MTGFKLQTSDIGSNRSAQLSHNHCPVDKLFSKRYHKNCSKLLTYKVTEPPSTKVNNCYEPLRSCVPYKFSFIFCNCATLIITGVARLDNLLDFGPLFKALGNN